MNDKSIFTFRSFEKVQFIGSAIIGLIAAIPISLMLPMYMDDFQRSIRGSFDWTSDGRPLAEVIYKLLVFDIPGTVLISPLGTLLCIPLICISSIVICRIFDNRKAWAAAMATIFIFIQPYFIQNLSYSFDSPFMVLSILFSLFSAYLLICIQTYIAGLLAVFLSICSLSLYQAANVALWIPVVLFVVLRPSRLNIRTYNFNQILGFRFPYLFTVKPRINVFNSLILCQILSFIIYKFVVLDNVELKIYAAKHAPVATLLELPKTIIENTIAYLNVLIDHWRYSNFGVVFLLFLLIFTCFSVIQAVKSPKSQSPYASLLCKISLKITSIIFVFIFSFGISLVLANPVFPPRTFIGIGIFMASIFLSSTRDFSFRISFDPHLRFIQSIQIMIISIVLISTSWACIYILFAYTNAYSSQKRLDEYHLASIVSLLRQNGYGYSDIAGVKVQGQLPFSPVTLNTFRTLPYLTSFIQPIKANWWTHIRLRHYGFIRIKRHNPVQPGQLIASDSLYDLSLVDKSLIITFKQ